MSPYVKAIRKQPQPHHHPCRSPEAAAAARRCVEREVAALRRVHGHPHVVGLLDVLATRSTVYLVLELARGGSVLSALDGRGGGHYDEPAARRLFAQLASAVAHAHSLGVFHRDVKPENLLLDERGDLRFTDFGLGAFTDADQHLGATDGLAATHCGSPAYVALEILLKRRYDAGKADVWSCGVVLFVLTTGYLPFNDGNSWPCTGRSAPPSSGARNGARRSSALLSGGCLTRNPIPASRLVKSSITLGSNKMGACHHSV
ncbi:hypothetical protein OsI_19502 [Oryza sativa Indica Group]|uniref:Protein kinase domain-containing protein n=1 Tax=Oryza sativa subsp. indica TaxID=39946 RepID=B8AWP3_ORYSI|nr:hypothetical protein OsI_19502 [Oryza sativa Indica Group]